MVGEREARAGARPARLGGALRQAWVGYRHQLYQELAAAGFGDRGFPDARVLRLCGGPSDVTISQIGREFGITRQGASKIVASLRDQGYVTLSSSPTDGREKIVKPTGERTSSRPPSGRQRAGSRRGSAASWDPTPSTASIAFWMLWALRTGRGWPTICAAPRA